MNYLKSLLFLIILSFFSCKKTKGITDFPFPDNISFLEEVKNHPEISAPEIKHLTVSQIEAKSSFSIAIFFKYEYYSDGRIKSITGADDKKYEYDNNKLTVSNTTIYLDANGLAKEIQGDNRYPSYYFKNSFLLKINDFWPKKKYSKVGNLLSYETQEMKIDFEYTDHINNIRQEVLNPQAWHLSARDLYLGKFSTNLLKKATFTGFTDNTLDFSYEFDDLNRVKKVNITRGDGNIFEYKLSY